LNVAEIQVAGDAKEKTISTFFKAQLHDINPKNPGKTTNTIGRWKGKGRMILSTLYALYQSRRSIQICLTAEWIGGLCVRERETT